MYAWKGLSYIPASVGQPGMNDRYILNESGEPELCDDPLRWKRWLEQEEHRIVRQQHLISDGSPVFVSTVFFGRDQRRFRDGPPLLWGTMVFDGVDEAGCEIDVESYSSRADAIAGHNQIVIELGDLPQC
jgi:hypothetical protein